jgi:DNA-directed RNA polymerase specialized sigma24 family protein
MGELSDASLLEQFITRRDESAFAALVARHGAMVLRSCRRILGNVQETEDVFQAVFLILARKAHTLKQPDALAGWLHGVARRAALKARRKFAKHACQTPLSDELLDVHSDPLARLTAR